MRKVTREAKIAFWSGETFKSKNTEVTIEHSASRSYCTVKLHGNSIIRRSFATPGSFMVNLAGWNTNTTRERINGFLSEYEIAIRCVDGNPYLVPSHKVGTNKNAHKPLNDNEWYSVEELIAHFYN